MRQRLFVLHRLSDYTSLLPVTLLRTFAMATIRSLYLYGAEIWAPTTQKQWQVLRSLQYRSAVLASGAPRFSSYFCLLLDLGWLPVEDDMLIRKACYLSRLRTSQRNLPLLLLISKRLDRFLKRRRPPKPRGVAEPLASLLRQHPSLSSPMKAEYDDVKSSWKLHFSQQLLSKWRATTSNVTLKRYREDAERASFFKFDSRITALLRHRLRLNRSALNGSVTFPPQLPVSCQCGASEETTRHFLLQCPLYDAIRNSVFQKCALLGFKPSLANFLGFQRKLDDKQYRLCLQETGRFIKTCGRFKRTPLAGGNAHVPQNDDLLH